MDNTGLIILAAGRSARLGQPKQLLPVNDKTLLQQVIDEAAKSGAQPIIVITGARAETIAAAIEKDKAEIVFNENWAQGKASGIVTGVQKMRAAYPNVCKIILAVCDQPFVMAELFSHLGQKQQESGKSIVASAYGGTLGTPVLFTEKYFDHLLRLSGEEGAKQLLLAHPEDVAGVDFPQGHIDIDSWEDYAGFLKGMGG